MTTKNTCGPRLDRPDSCAPIVPRQSSDHKDQSKERPSGNTSYAYSIIRGPENLGIIRGPENRDLNIIMLHTEISQDYSPCYTMSSIYFALAFYPNANATQLQRKQFYLYYTIVFHHTFVNLGSFLMILKLFSQHLIIISVKMDLEESPMEIPLRFLT